MDLSTFTKENKFLMLALDHRESFLKMLNPQHPELVEESEAIKLKGEIIKSVQDQLSGLLIDVKYGLPAYKDKTKPFLLPLEKSGVDENKGEKINVLEYSVRDLMNLGASGAKILLYFDENPQTINTQLQTAKLVLEQCKQNSFPLFIEIRVYNPATSDLSQERAKILLDTLQKFIQANIIPDVFKLEYPGSFEDCKKITQLLNTTPWILLTKGDTFEEFQSNFKDAVKAGCRGFLAGRALWQEVFEMSGDEKLLFLQTTLPQRFAAISKIALK